MRTNIKEAPKNFATYAEEILFNFNLHMETLKSTWSYAIQMCFDNTK